MSCIVLSVLHGFASGCGVFACLVICCITCIVLYLYFVVLSCVVSFGLVLNVFYRRCMETKCNAPLYVVSSCRVLCCVACGACVNV